MSATTVITQALLFQDVSTAEQFDLGNPEMFCGLRNRPGLGLSKPMSVCACSGPSSYQGAPMRTPVFLSGPEGQTRRYFGSR